LKKPFPRTISNVFGNAVRENRKKVEEFLQLILKQGFGNNQVFFSGDLQVAVTAFKKKNGVAITFDHTGVIGK
jgi:hypothetical protein